ncbi:MAG: flagellar biosynthesis anti-sigma factor FlgM [Deltaproteobacteria bacterium]|nr:flagellar biosynthesis anti-sigma factor FlgM [Deltaproteobacteria bacterium]
MTMWFFDEAEELEEYQTFRRQDQPLELEYLKIRVALGAAEAALREHPEDKERETKVAEIKEKIATMEQRAPWLTFDYPVEYLLWGPPHG